MFRRLGRPAHTEHRGEKCNRCNGLSHWASAPGSLWCRLSSLPSRSTGFQPVVLQHRLEACATKTLHQLLQRLGVVVDEVMRPAGQVGDGGLAAVDAEVVVEGGEDL